MIADLAVGVGLRPQIGRRAPGVADHLVVGHAAGRAHARAEVIRAASALAEVQMRRDRRKSVMGELARGLDDQFVPAGHVHG